MSDAVRIAAAEIPPGSGRMIEVRGRQIAVFNVGKGYRAVDDACSHEGGPLSEGALDGTVVTCPWHGARFDVTTGAALSQPAPHGVAMYPVRVSGPDLFIEVPTAEAGQLATETGQLTLTLAAKRRETPDVTSFQFRREEPLRWHAGQFLRYWLPHPDPDSRGITRYFTIASAPFEDQVMLTTRFAEGRGSTFKQALQALPIGGAVEVSQPAGEFTLSEPHRPHVLIAGGIGITPYRAMLLDLDYHGLPVSATLLYANRTANLVYQDELDALRRRHPRLVVRPFVSPTRITRDAIASVAAKGDVPIFLVSGPEPFVRSMEDLLAEMGVPAARVKRDYFPGYDWA